MTNVVPQSPASNQKAWERLESYCRSLVKKGSELHIACGPHGLGGTGKNGRRETIGKGKIEVTAPAQLWKGIVVLPSEGAEPRKNRPGIAVLMPNETEAGLVPFLWEGADAPTSERLRQLAGAAADAAIEEATLPDLLRTVPSEDRSKFQALQKTLEAQLSGIHVYKVGDEPEKV